MTIYEKLLRVQSALKAPKDSYNNFGKYKYRTCESILQAVKPCLVDVAACLTLSDEILEIGGFHYLVSKAVFRDAKTDETIVVAPGKEEIIDKFKPLEIKEIVATHPALLDMQVKGMSGPQITGAAASYARKYALCGLLLIDDNNDPDTPVYQDTVARAEEEALKAQKAEEARIEKANAINELTSLVGADGLPLVLNWCNTRCSSENPDFVPVSKIEDLPIYIIERAVKAKQAAIAQRAEEAKLPSKTVEEEPVVIGNPNTEEAIEVPNPPVKRGRPKSKMSGAEAADLAMSQEA